MEAVEEVAAPPATGRNNNDPSPIAKGKRTKRHRTHSPIPFTIAPPNAATCTPTPTPTATNNHPHPRSPTSAVSSEESSTTEEVDTARCLILLSQGRHFSPDHGDGGSSSRRYGETATAYGNSNTKTTGVVAYTCKTCNRAFPSFQALGGHRASHKKPRIEKKSAMFSDEEDFPSPQSMSSYKNRISPKYSLSLQLSNASTTTFSATMKSSPSPRIHVCSYCGAEFTSGQALGGHMRKHRGGPIVRSPNVVPLDASIEEPEPEPEESKKSANGLTLDLNLPAPEEKSPKETNQRFGPCLSNHYYSTID